MVRTWPSSASQMMAGCSPRPSATWRSTQLSDRFMRPPSNQRGKAIPREVSRTRAYGLIHRKPRSLDTASQYHSASSTLRRWSASSEATPCARMNLVRRARSMTSGVGRQMISLSDISALASPLIHSALTSGLRPSARIATPPGFTQPSSRGFATQLEHREASRLELISPRLATLLACGSSAVSQLERHLSQLLRVAALCGSWSDMVAWPASPSGPLPHKENAMKAVAAVAEILKREGVKFLIGYPVNPIIEAAAQADIRTIIVRQERTGLHMADAVSRISSGDRIGVFAMQHGPGSENAFGGVAQAYGDSVPIVVLPGG